METKKYSAIASANSSHLVGINECDYIRKKNSITANDIPAEVILSVGFNPILFAVCVPTINRSPPSMKKNFKDATRTTSSILPSTAYIIRG